MTSSTFKTPARRAYAQPLSRAMSGLAKRALDKRGFVDAKILEQWPQIAGDLIGSHSLPERIVFQRDRSKPGTLHLRLANGALATEIIHFEPLLLERLNRYFGFRAVGAIKLIHGPLPQKRSATRPPLPKLNPAQESKVAEDVEGVTDEDLRHALTRLGTHVARRRVFDHDNPKVTNSRDTKTGENS